MNTAVLNLGLAATNEARQRSVSALSQQKIAYILEERAKIAGFKQAKEEQKQAGDKLALSVVTYKDVTGQELPTTPNQNQATIIKALADMNEVKQKSVAAQTKLIIDSIRGYDASIEATEKRISEMLAEMAKIELDVVTAEQVVG